MPLLPGKKVLEFLAATLRRAWVAFSLVAMLGLVVAEIMEPENLLVSDDPYLAGAVFGAIAAGMAAVYSLAELPGWHRVVYPVAVCSWCVLLLVVGCSGGEGSGMALFIAQGSVVSALVSWAVCRMRIGRVWIAVAALGVAFVAMYAFVASRMAARWL